MTPYYSDDWLTVFLGDCREVMSSMPAESVHCVVTSPPYWGLRDYGIGEKSLGLEPTPELFVEAMVAVFREVRRVLRKDGTVWLNLGDSYAGSGPNTNADFNERNGHGSGQRKQEVAKTNVRGYVGGGLKPKDLVGIPWRVAFALQADGWYLRSDVIWSKPNPMPESVTDRPTKAHEYVFLLSKSPRYYYDADAVREPSQDVLGPERLERGNRGLSRDDYDPHTQGWNGKGLVSRYRNVVENGRNLRSVWNIATEPYPGAHFATFPRALVEPCVKAGTSEKGVCPECGAPWVRQVERVNGASWNDHAADLEHGSGGSTGNGRARKQAWLASKDRDRTGTWHPTCHHYPAHLQEGELAGNTRRCIPATVLDPFAGSGTTGLVAQSLSRRAVLIDLSADYLTQLMDRNRDIPLGLAGG